MIIESQKTIIKKTNQQIVDYVSKIENFQQLMPDTVAKFEVTEKNTFKFALTGMPEFELKVASTTPEGVQLISASDKTPFKLNLNLKSLSTDQTEGQFIFEGEFNAMIAMMIKKPISNFLDVLITKLSMI